ncbi:MAG: hypothetical protein MZV63_54375 [Marinilabiliales bacterium]|nr:hypothetical protein [Marinilabiliales bacterium]
MKYLLVIPASSLLLTAYLTDTVRTRGEEMTSGRRSGSYGQAEVIISYPGFEAMTELAERFSVSSCDGKEARADPLAQ